MAYTIELTGDQIFDAAELIRKVTRANSPSHNMPVKDAMALLDLLHLLPEPSEEDAQAWLAKQAVPEVVAT